MAPQPRTVSAVTGPATLLLAHAHARADGLASVPVGAGYAVVVPGFDDKVTVLPGLDAREVLRRALEDAIIVAQANGDEVLERSYLALLHPLEDSGTDPLLDCDHTVTFSCNPDGAAGRLTHVGQPRDH